MQKLWQMLDDIIRKLKSYIVATNSPTIAGRKLYETTKGLLGQDITPQDEVSDDVACAAVVNRLCELAFGEPAGGGASTYWLRLALKNHRNFALVDNFLPGDI